VERGFDALRKFTVKRKARESNSDDLAVGSFQDCCNTIMRAFLEWVVGEIDLGVSPANLRGNNHHLGAGRSERFRDFLSVNSDSLSSAVLLARGLSISITYRFLNHYLTLPLLEAALSDYYQTLILTHIG
jgi:hypothetical protein